MEKTIISPSQLLAFGTALVIPIGLAGGRGVWLSILIALPGGLGMNGNGF